MSITAADYAVLSGDVTNALQQLASSIDANTLDDVNSIISMTGTGSIDIQTAISSIQELHEFETKVLNAIKIGFDVTNSKISDVDHMVKYVCDLTMDLRRRMDIDKMQETGEALQTIIRADCDETEKEKQAINLLYNFVEVIQGKKKYTEENIKRNIKAKIIWNDGLSIKLIDQLSEMFGDVINIPDAYPGPVSLGSILLPMQYSSMTGLLEVMAYMVDPYCRRHLSAISYTVSNILGFSCSFSWTVITQDLQDVIATKSGQSEAGDKSSESKSIVLPFQSTSLTGLIHVWRMFGGGKRNRHIEKISETLSEMFGAQISLMTSVDLDHCVEALYKTEGLASFAAEENDTCYVENTWNSEKETGSTSEVENEQVQDRLKSIQEALSEVVAEERTKNDTSEVEVVSTSQQVTGSTLDVENKQEERIKNIHDMESTSELENKQEQERFKEVDSTQTEEIKHEQVNVRNSQDANTCSKEKTEPERNLTKNMEGTTSRLDSSCDLKSVIAKQERKKIVHYTAFLKGWPGMNRTHQSIRHIVDRCSHLENELGMSEQSMDMSKDVTEIDIFISSSLNLDPFSLPLRPQFIEETETLFLDVSERTDEAFPLRQKCFGIFIDNRGVKMVEAISSEQIDVVTENAEGNASTTDNSVLDPDQIKQQLSSFLERVVFEPLTEKFNFLKDLQNMKLDKSSSESKLGNSVLQHKDTIEQLLGESIALFKLSSLPADKRPVAMEYQEKQISKEVEDELFRLDDTIRGCGYSYGTFNVDVESLSDEKKSLKRKKRITDLLGKYGIFNVKFNIVSKSVSEYKRVGAEIGTSHSCGSPMSVCGTLGCFASITLEETTSLCALLSKHIAYHCSEKVYVNDNGEVMQLGCILKETLVSGGVDIAAAKIHQEHVAKCDVEFKNSENVPLPGKLLTSDDDYIMEGLHVHLWGASSKPGFGIIRVPKYSCSGQSHTYIELGDRDTKDGITRLAVPGDSGAVVCADDPGDRYVYVISMLMGTTTFDDSPKTARKYIAFFLQNGIEVLQSTIKGKLSLKGIGNG